MAQSHDHREFRTWVVTEIIPDAIGLFLEKNEGYPYEISEFGAKAEIVELHRKYKKLKHAIWDGHPLVGEQAKEVAQDMIGHLILLIDALDQEDDLEMVREQFPEFTAEEWQRAYMEAIESLQDLEDLRTDG